MENWRPWQRTKGSETREAGNTQGEPCSTPTYYLEKTAQTAAQGGWFRQALTWRCWVWESGETASQGRVLDKRAAQEEPSETCRRGPLISTSLWGTHKPEERATQKHNREGYQSSYNNPCLQSRKLHLHREIEKAHRRIRSHLPKL